MNLETLKRRFPDNKVMIINGNIYDVTQFADIHPGGSEILDEYLYKDATSAFNEVGHSTRAQKLLEKYIFKTNQEEDTSEIIPNIDVTSNIQIPESSTNSYASNFEMKYVTESIILVFWNIMSYLSRGLRVVALYTGLGSFFHNTHPKTSGHESVSHSADTKTEHTRITESTPVSFSVVGTHEPPKSSLRVRAQICKIVSETSDCYRVTLSLPPSIDTEKLLKAGRHIKIIHPDRTTIKSYTPVTYYQNTLQLIIKRYTPTDIDPMRGKMSRFITESLCDDYIELEIPTGKIWLEDILETNPMYQLNVRGSVVGFKKIVAFCGGTGITPVYSMIKHILNRTDQNNTVHIDLYNSFKTFDQIILHNELTDLAEKYNNFHVVHMLTRESKSCDSSYQLVELSPNVHRCDGHIDKQFVVDHLIIPTQSQDVSDTICLVCGPKSFVGSIEFYLRNVFKDRLIIL